MVTGDTIFSILLIANLISLSLICFFLYRLLKKYI